MKVKLMLMTIGTGLMVAVSGFSQTPNPGQPNSPTPPATTPNPNSNGAPTANPDSNLNPGQAPVGEQNANPEQNSPRAATPPASPMTFEGRLLKVDTAAKAITVAGLGGKEGATGDMSFRYDDKTVIVGGDKTAQGLDGKTGSMLKITYQADHETNMASRIEISDKP